MARVGIIEQHYHSHIAYYYTLAAHAGGHDVTLFTTQTLLDRIEDGFDLPDIDVELRGDRPLDEYLPTLQERSGEFDCYIANTVNGDPDDFIAWSGFHPECPWGVNTYGMKRWFGPQPVEFDGPVIKPAEEGRKAFEAAHRQAVLRNATIAIFQYSGWADYLGEQTLPLPVYHYPYVVHDPDLLRDHGSDGPLEVAVPGAVKRRRDYEEVTSAVKALWDDGFDSQLSLTIVGRAADSYAERLFKEEFKPLLDDGYPIRFFDRGWLDREFYDDQLRRADVFVCPVIESQELRGYEEVLGITHGTGVIWDAIRHATPIVLPDYFALGDELGGAITYTGRDGLRDVLRRLVVEDDLLPSLRDDARENATAFGLGRQTARFDHLLAALGVG